MSRYAIATNVQISVRHNQLDTPVQLAHICDIQQTNEFDKILSNIHKHGIQQKSRFLFLLKWNEMKWKLYVSRPNLAQDSNQTTAFIPSSTLGA